MKSALKPRKPKPQVPSAALMEYAMSTSQHSQLSIAPGIGRRKESEPSDGRYEPTIGLKAVAKILDCSAEQCRRAGRGQEDSRVPNWLSLEIHRLGHCQVARRTASIDSPFASF